MRLTIVGCAGSFPGPDSPASCYLIEADGFRLVLDLGNGALGALQRFAELQDIDAICLSHQHADHCLDMCAYSVVRTYHPDGRMPPIPVYGPARTGERLSRALGLDPGTSMTDAFDFITLTPGTIEIGPLLVTVDHVNHPVETFAFRLAHGGVSIAYSADTGPADALVTLASGADLLLCEASFVDGPGLPADLHLTARQAGEHAARAGAGQLVLTHLVTWNDRERTRAEAAAAFGGQLSLAVAGQVLAVG
ncbi:MAG TPA: MBL fold metallo-hydrolase [Streptosporangiaceae bacterium]|nr:MBL fold metallo-hydrolase [Streptosporangiaceae bacterium]